MAAKKAAADAKKSETAAPAPVAAPAPKKEKKAPAAKAEVVVPTVTTPAPAAAAAPAETRSAEAVLTGLVEQLKGLQSELTTRVRSTLTEVAAAAKAVKREARESKRKVKVDPATLSPEARAAWEKRRANNAFLRQRPISDELAAFMGVAAGSKRSQTEVTKFIADYVKSHGCFDAQFKRRIIPNAALAKLLRVTDKTEVTYLNLQSFLKVHFSKA
jgi:chromatin remodeling complex protein RSC6